MRIEVNNLRKTYKNKNYVLDGLDLNLENPSMIGLVGPNGAGKTTLMKILVGQLLPSSGKVSIDGMDLTKNEKYLKSKLGYLPQDFGLYDELTVYQFLDYMACLKGIKSDRDKAVERCIKDTSLEDKKKNKIKTLSGGQKQRVGIAQALLNDPELFIVDEPTVGLDPKERIKFRNLFSKNASSNLVILSTHIIDDVQSICSRLIVMNKGSILFDGAPSQLIKEAQGHAATIELETDTESMIEDRFKVTSRVITPRGACCRIVGDEFPPSSSLITPTLEDAYIYCMMKGEKKEHGYIDATF